MRRRSSVDERANDRQNHAFLGAVRSDSRRLRDRAVVSKLFDELGPRFAKRPGGYLRILKYGFRQGDNAPMALVELVDRSSEADADATVENKAAAPKAKAAASKAAAPKAKASRATAKAAA